MLAHLLALIRAARPTMTLLPRSVVEALVLTGGSLGSAHIVAHRLGLTNRFALERMIKRAGLPPLHRLGGWISVISWLESAEREGESLCHLAFRSGRHPAACYRLVKATTGSTWNRVRARGILWAAGEFLKEIDAHSSFHLSPPPRRAVSSTLPERLPLLKPRMPGQRDANAPRAGASIRGPM